MSGINSRTKLKLTTEADSGICYSGKSPSSGFYHAKHHW